MRLAASFVFVAAGLCAGCASAPWEGDRNPGRPPQAQGQETVYEGVVESVREVEVDSARTGVGPMAGAVIGGTVGGEVGRGRGSAAGVVVGTVIGAVAGEAAAQAGTLPGLEITVRLDEGRVIAVTQRKDAATFKPGDRVRVLADGRSARVTH
ncbi:MAG: hypothetical protein HYV99_02900 [Betaproteobacteria bacterium]|nr:hypothetical protein [Betaproteobacteria bacterium]MBI2508953.1 hypothetical protein [Betaproteobacteria bacterium]